jgi:hypothetical protein
MNDIILIGIDDTDIIGSQGTGRMARDLAGYLVNLGMGSTLGITRHQLLVDDRIPYTSHNSSLCIGLKTNKQINDFYQPSAEFMKANFREGADPGLCICHRDRVDDEIIDFGLKAQNIVLTKQDAIDLAIKSNLFLVELGGTGGGIIGALSAVALRAEGNNGRFVDLPGIRDISGMITVAEVLARTDINSVMNTDEILLNYEDIIDSRDWIRPTLVNGKPILKVKPRLSTPRDTAWTSVELREREKHNRKEFAK